MTDVDPGTERRLVEHQVFAVRDLGRGPDARGAGPGGRPLHVAALRCEGQRRGSDRGKGLGRRRCARSRGRARSPGPVPARPFGGVQAGRRRAPRRARRPRVFAARARERAGAGGAGEVHPAGSAAPAAQPGADPRADAARARPAAGGVLRHRLPSHDAAGGAGVRAAEVDHRPRRGALRISRAVLRVHRERAAEGRAAGRVGQDGRAAPRQRLEHVRDVRRPQRGEHDGVHGRRRPAHGHPLRQPRSRVSSCT